MDFTNQYDWNYRLYKGKIISENFTATIPKNVSVRIDKSMIASHTAASTPFAEVKILPFQKPEKLVKFVNELRPQKTDLKTVWQTIKSVIFKNWMPDKIHVIGSSSGYDSRLIAKAIKELSREHPGWLGETYFIECGGEGEAFTEIMKRLKIKSYIVWTPEYSFDYFDKHHTKFNGLSAFPVNQWYDFYKKNWNLNDIQYISGYGGNVADMMNDHTKYMTPVKQKLDLKNKLYKYFSYQYYYQISAFKRPPNSFHPFWSWDYIRVMSGFDGRFRRTAEYLSKVLVSECDNIRRMPITETAKRGYRKVNTFVLRKLYEKFKSTDYGRRINATPDGELEYNLWWLHYCIASFLNDKEYYGKD